MKAKQIIAILNQFDPDARVLIDAGGAILMPADIAPVSGGVLIHAYSEAFYAKGPTSTATEL